MKEMQQLSIAIFVFILSTAYVLALSHIASSAYALQKSLVFPIILFFIFLYFSPFTAWKKIVTHKQKWLLLFLCTVFIQILVLSTGGIKSPFLILIHLSIIGLSFLFTFTISLLFLIFTFLVLGTDVSLYPHLADLLSQEPTTLILQTISFIVIIPVSYIISENYHFKDIMLQKLQKQTLTDEAILQNLDELVIITDLNLHILSINDAAKKILNKTNYELLHKPLFTAVLFKDPEDKLITKETFFPNGDMTTPKQYDDYFTLVASSSVVQKKFTIHVQTTKDLEDKVDQISFIFNENINTSFSSSLKTIIERARARYEAMNETLKKDLLTKTPKEIRNQILMLEKIESDIYEMQLVKSSAYTTNSARIDLAQFGKQSVLLNQDFAKIFDVLVDFALHNFSTEDIAPLMVNNFAVKPEHLTGPFFTVECDTKQIELIIKKLLAVAIFIASKETKAQVILSVERGNNEDIILTIEGKAPKLTNDEAADVFIANYGKLADKTNMQAGSGLEGYLAKTVADNLGLQLDAVYNEASSTLSFKLSVPRKIS